MVFFSSKRKCICASVRRRYYSFFQGSEYVEQVITPPSITLSAPLANVVLYLSQHYYL